jgi:copper resistance protein C
MRRLASSLLALGLAVGVAAGLVIVGGGAALAHDVLERTSPAAGTTVDRMPQTVTLTFSEEPLDIGTQVVVSGPAGPVSSGVPAVKGRDVTQAVSPSAPAGDYTVSYRVTSDDGHPVTGTFGFHATVGLDGSTATAGPSAHVSPDSAAADEAKGSPFVPVLLTIIGTVVLLAIGGYLVLRAREADRS